MRRRYSDKPSLEESPHHAPRCTRREAWGARERGGAGSLNQPATRRLQTEKPSLRSPRGAPGAAPGELGAFGDGGGVHPGGTGSRGGVGLTPEAGPPPLVQQDVLREALPESPHHTQGDPRAGQRADVQSEHREDSGAALRAVGQRGWAGRGRGRGLEQGQGQGQGQWQASGWRGAGHARGARRERRCAGGVPPITWSPGGGS